MLHKSQNHNCIYDSYHLGVELHKSQKKGCRNDNYLLGVELDTDVTHVTEAKL